MSAPAPHDNFTLKEEIRAYWSARAESFDRSFGHAIKSDRELKAFQRLIGDSFGPEPLDVLDLACGTGEITRALLSLKHRVTALDFSEAMLERARAKHGKAARFRLGDAEHLLDEDASYDAAITRHLVWTLPDPAAAFADWFRVLKPGGRLLIVDADTALRSRKARLLQRIATVLKRFGKAVESPGVDPQVHNRIVSQVHFSGGAQAEAIAALLTAAGFTAVTIDRDHGKIRRAQARHMPLHQCLSRAAQDRYAISAAKPFDTEKTDAQPGHRAA